MVSILKDIAIDGLKIVPCRIAMPNRGVVKSFLVAGQDRVILVDTGASGADADLIMDAIRDMGHQHEDLKLCILTHRHGDHTGGLKKLKKTIRKTAMKAPAAIRCLAGRGSRFQSFFSEGMGEGSSAFVSSSILGAS